MEKEYWLSRKRASLELARNAVGSEARLIHIDLAGRYGLKVSAVETQAIDVSVSVSPANSASGTNRSIDGSDDA